LKPAVFSSFCNDFVTFVANKKEPPSMFAQETERNIALHLIGAFSSAIESVE